MNAPDPSCRRRRTRRRITPRRRHETDTATLLDEPAPRALVSASRAVGGGGAAGAGGARACGIGKSQEKASAAPSYTTEPVRRGNLTLTVTANGTLQPTRSIAIGSELSGTVLKVQRRRQRPHQEGPGAGRARHRKAARPDPALARDARRREREGRADRRDREGGAGNARPLRGSGATVRRQGAVEDRARHRSRDASSARVPTRRRPARASPMRRRRCPPTRSTCRKRRFARLPTV